MLPPNSSCFFKESKLWVIFLINAFLKISQEMRCWQRVEPADLVGCHMFPLPRKQRGQLPPSRASCQIIIRFRGQSLPCWLLPYVCLTRGQLADHYPTSGDPSLLGLPNSVCLTREPDANWQTIIPSAAAGNLLGAKYCLVECPTRGLEANCQMIIPSAVFFSQILANICPLTFSLFC